MGNLTPVEVRCDEVVGFCDSDTDVEVGVSVVDRLFPVHEDVGDPCARLTSDMAAMPAAPGQ